MMFDQITAERLRDVLDYCPSTGIFTRKFSHNRWHAGTVAGSLHHHGYIHINIDHTIYGAHRLAWLHVYGVMPDLDMDHINGVRADNRIANLRVVTRAENCQNRWRGNKNSSSGLLGVQATAKGSNKPWRATITVNRRLKILGSFDHKEEAYAAYLKAKKTWHPNSDLAKDLAV